MQLFQEESSIQSVLRNLANAHFTTLFNKQYHEITINGGKQKKNAKKITRSCDVCTYDNNIHSPNCLMCETPKQKPTIQSKQKSLTQPTQKPTIQSKQKSLTQPTQKPIIQSKQKSLINDIKTYSKKTR